MASSPLSWAQNQQVYTFAHSAPTYQVCTIQLEALVASANKLRYTLRSSVERMHARVHSLKELVRRPAQDLSDSMRADIRRHRAALETLGFHHAEGE